MASIDTIVRVRKVPRWLAGSPAAVALLVLAAACSSSSSNNSPDAGSCNPDDGPVAGVICQYHVHSQALPAATCASAGAAIPGMDNGHCGTGATAMAQATGACVAVGTSAPSGDDGASGGDDAAGDAAAGDDNGDDAAAAALAANCGESGYGVTNFGTSAADDDCKYDVSWTSTPICENGNVYFTVTAKKRAGADGAPALSDEPPLLGAAVDAEVVHSDCMTIAPNTCQTTVEQGGGVYKVGPIQFDKSGKWSVRFHFNECCSDDPEDSPHGHAAFWVNVP